MIIPHLIFLALHLPYATGYKNQLSSSPLLNIKTNSKGIFSEISINEHSSSLFGLGWRLYWTNSRCYKLGMDTCFKEKIKVRPSE